MTCSSPTTLLAMAAFIAGVPARAESIDEWVRKRVEVQRATPAPATPATTDSKPPAFTPAKGRKKIPGFTPPTSLAPLIRAVRPAVVNISAKNESGTRSLGSGFIIDPTGLVVTNNHVIERASSIAVRLADGRELQADVEGKDPATDLALLRLRNASSLTAVSLGDSDELEVGDWVVAIGNPFGLDTSVTNGIISARERVIGVGPYDDFIQTNVLMNPGNSGGPLFDMSGDVVGVTTAIINQGQGIGFAVPMNLVSDLLPNLLDNGKVDRGWLGVNVQESMVDNRPTSVITDIYEGSPAAKAGLQTGDRILSVQGHAVERYQQLLRHIALLGPGATVKLSIQRGTKTLSPELTLVTRPETSTLKVQSLDDVRGLGIVVSDVKGNTSSTATLNQVIPMSPAAKAGLLAGDVILEVNRMPVASSADVVRMLNDASGSDFLFKLQRGSTTRFIAVTKVAP